MISGDRDLVGLDAITLTPGASSPSVVTRFPDEGANAACSGSSALWPGITTTPVLFESVERRTREVLADVPALRIKPANHGTKAGSGSTDA